MRPDVGRCCATPPRRASEISPETFARQLLRRWGVVFRDLVARETLAPPWRDLLVELRRMESRGEIRGGRFTGAFLGEQFALPEALDLLRAMRRAGESDAIPEVPPADPLHLAGIILPGPRRAVPRPLHHRWWRRCRIGGMLQTDRRVISGRGGRGSFGRLAAGRRPPRHSPGRADVSEERRSRRIGARASPPGLQRRVLSGRPRPKTPPTCAPSRKPSRLKT